MHSTCDIKLGTLIIALPELRGRGGGRGCRRSTIRQAHRGLEGERLAGMEEGGAGWAGWLAG